MYLSFYGFQSDPFHVTPDPSRLYLTEPYKDAIGALLYGVLARKGFMAVTGDAGVGKTSVLRYCLQRISTDKEQFGEIEIVYVIQPVLTPRELYALLCTELMGTVQNKAPADCDLSTLVQALHEYLFAAYDKGTSVVVVVDEAQNMPVETLESFRTLSNLETNRDKFLQIVLVGQTELDALLARNELRQLDQRIAVRAFIPRLSPSEARAYIRHRVGIANPGQAEPFTRGAVNLIVAAAEGNPRRINMICDNALMNGFGHRLPKVDRKVAREAIESLRNRSRQTARRLPLPPRLMTAAAAGLALLGLAGLAMIGSHYASGSPWSSGSALLADKEAKPAATSAPAQPHPQQTAASASSNAPAGSEPVTGAPMAPPQTTPILNTARPGTSLPMAPPPNATILATPVRNDPIQKIAVQSAVPPQPHIVSHFKGKLRASALTSARSLPAEEEEIIAVPLPARDVAGQDTSGATLATSQGQPAQETTSEARSGNAQPPFVVTTGNQSAPSATSLPGLSPFQGPN